MSDSQNNIKESQNQNSGLSLDVGQKVTEIRDIHFLLIKMMQLGSCDCSKTDLDLQAVPPTMTTVQDSQWVDFHPIASMDSFSAPIEFVVPSHAKHYVEFFQTLLSSNSEY